MIVGPNWKQHVYNDRELNGIERRGNGTLEDLAALLCREIERMSDEEKAELRKSWLDYVDEKENDRRFLRSVGVDPDGD
ncbi:MAG TPA: hypothetical protein VNH19_02105 [Candidatus Limnocylindrales bacterium]|nr:hypothetical protein [Candidatus Limnocylindrales bacterium]